MKVAGTGWMAATLALSLTLGSAVFAQQGRGFGLMRGGGAALLMRPEVQTELKLTDAQKTQVTELMAKVREEFQSRGQEVFNAPLEQRPRLMAAWQAETMKRANAILNPDQQKRFKEISLQQQGPAALATPAVADELKLTPEQRTKIQAILQQQSAAAQALFENAGEDRAAAQQKLAALRAESDTKITAVLTDEQRARWTQMLGTPLPLAPIGAFGR